MGLSVAFEEDSMLGLDNPRLVEVEVVRRRSMVGVYVMVHEDIYRMFGMDASEDFCTTPRFFCDPHING